ncbi:GNAT family N-acetyltransferase [Sphaerisporangium rubeum]|uniref:GNAT superfamily N-acetyltransferase n=1 Tax=Sphaerisporangium rubeum TaxID=321317 RepID=A0A7X0IK34_9ACTN|nr:GNAT family N-acetyltransferase [Sphaerisporangium rubeum]MBB6476669.1 GNAT superfamily N-acetyltransferase [Sphaerisporangium rubeum]
MSVTFRAARREDVPLIVSMLADDALGARREGDPRDEVYLAAFEAIDADPRQELVVAEHDGTVAGTMQITYIPGLSRRGAERALIEAVRVHAAMRGQGLGRAMMRWAVERARERGCRMVQLTSDKARADAHRFYTSLGFVDSHVGFKLTL